MISLAAILEFPKHRIDKTSRYAMEKGVIKMIRKIRPDWSKQDIILLRFTEGYSNIIVGGYTDKKEEMILVKIYGNEAVDKSKEVFAMRLFASRRFGSRVFATFANGYVYEYAPGIPLTYELCIDHHMYPLIAKRIGELHREMRHHSPLQSKSGHVFDTLRDWLTQVPLRLADPEDNARLKKELPSKAALERELEEMEAQLNVPSDLANPLIYCHGDLNPANIIFDPQTRTLVFIDLEFAGANFQAFEIAQHFMTFSCGRLDRVGRDEFVPAREFQLRWCHAYLTGYRGLPEDQIAHRDIEYLWLLVQKFSLVYCLQEVIWALVRTDVANIPGFDILQYGILRFKQYHRNKYQIMSMQII